MKHSKLIVEKRTIQGNQNRKLRKIGIIPAVIFSKTLDSVMIQIPIGEFTKVYKEAGKTHVIDVICDNESYSTIIHGIDIHPVKHLPRHVDFLAVDLKQKVEAEVPVVITGEARGVKENGLVLSQPIDTIKVSCLPDNIPNQLEIDITNLLEIGDHVSISDLVVNSNVEIIDELDDVIATLVAQSVEVVEETSAEATEETNEETSSDKTNE
jgi:large subunit ribosomal protein L25